MSQKNPLPPKYDPIKYWLEEKSDLLKSGQTADSLPSHREHCRAMVFLLGSIKDEIRSVLEIGCGYGRLTKYLLDSATFPNLKRYDAIDLSPLKVETAIDYIPTYKYVGTLTLWKENFAAVPMKTARIDIQKAHEGGYDLVFSSQVLMHQLPSDIDYWVKKMSALSKKYIMNLDWFEDQEPANVAPHNFIHDYEKIYMRQVEPIPHNIQSLRMSDLKQTLYLVTKGNQHGIVNKSTAIVSHNSIPSTYTP